jgi:type IV secretion system protein VirB8
VTDVAKIAPWRARPLSDAAKNAKFREVMDLAAERVILGRSAVIAGWSVGAAGVVLALAAAIAVAALVPLKTTEVRFLLVDQSTGIIGAPVGLEDAPKLFNDAVARQYLKRYVEAREEWVPQMDQENDHLAKLMSTPDEQTRYAAWRNSPTSPIKAVGPEGHVGVENFRFHKQAVGKGETLRWLVQFDRTVWRGGAKDTPQPQSWSATIDFEWRPQLPMTPRDRDDNPGGFLAISYSASPDTPDDRRQ